MAEHGFDIPFHKPAFPVGTAKELQKLLSLQSLHGGGDYVRGLEEDITKAFFPGAFLMLTPSCTSALEIACRAAGFGPGDEVLVPAYTFISSANAIALTGAKPVFVDINADTICMNLDQAKSRITERTKGMMYVHYAGYSPHPDRLSAFAKANNLTLIEDAAQSFGATRSGHHIGQTGAMSCFSFHDTKVFSSGEGGALLVNDETYLDQAVRIREKGSNRREFLKGKIDRYGWADLGVSGYMAAPSAALLKAQFNGRENILTARQELLSAYVNRLGPVLGGNTWHYFNPDAEFALNGHFFWMTAPDKAARIKMQNHLAENGIQAQTHYPALHQSPYPVKMGWDKPGHPVAEHVADSLLRLPLFTDMTMEQLDRVCGAVKSGL